MGVRYGTDVEGISIPCSTSDNGVLAVKATGFEAVDCGHVA